MKEGPNIALVAAMIGDPARANMILALMSGLSLSATELAREAGITASTASSHLAKLEASGLIAATSRGRHRYFSVANPDVAHAVEGLVSVAARAGHLRTRAGPEQDSMRRARSCYDHLGGQLAVGLFENWLSRRLLGWEGGVAEFTVKGEKALAKFGIDINALKRERRPLCRTCIDWSEREKSLGRQRGRRDFRTCGGKPLGRSRCRHPCGEILSPWREKIHRLVLQLIGLGDAPGFAIWRWPVKATSPWPRYPRSA